MGEGCVIDWLLAPAKGHLQIDHVKIIIDFNSEFEFPNLLKKGKINRNYLSKKKNQMIRELNSRSRIKILVEHTGE